MTTREAQALAHLLEHHTTSTAQAARWCTVLSAASVTHVFGLTRDTTGVAFVVVTKTPTPSPRPTKGD